MSEEMTKLLVKLHSIQHKCKQTKCKQMSEEFENMTKFILYSNQLNTYYLNLINDFKDISNDNQSVVREERLSLLKTVSKEMKTINKTIVGITKDVENIDEDVCDLNKTLNIRCDLCHKQLSSKLLTTHLSQHLNTIFKQKISEDFETDIKLKRRLSEEILVPFVDSVVKKEEISESDNESNYYMNFDGMPNGFSDKEELSEEETKREPTKVKEIKRKTCSQKSSKSTPKLRKKSKNTNTSQICVVICDECGKCCKNNRHLSHHLSRVHNISKKTSNNCHLCDFGNVTIQELKIHLLTEHRISPNKWNFHCNWPDCGQVFRFRTALDKHIRTHTGDLLYKCEWPGCNIQFNKQWKIVEHMRSHTGEKPFKCVWPGCDKAFGYRSSYRHHVLSHNKQKHRCYFPSCDKSYPFVHQLEEHILNVHKKDEKPFVCTEEGCDRTFATKQNLKYHMVIHNNRTRFKCSYEGCKRSFVEEKSLKKHLERPHGTIKHLANGRQLYQDYKCDWPGCEYQANIASNLKIHRMRAHTGEKPEKCTHPGCEFAAVRKFELRVHMLKHTGEMPYPCCYPNCCRRFKSQRALDTHISKNHSLN